MISGIKFNNYKAFKDGQIEIKPITILLGANSVGKSSLIQLFLLLQETAISENYKSALKLNGAFFSLGEGINLFRKRDIENTLRFEIEFNLPENNSSIRNSFFERYFEEVMDYCYYLIRSTPNNEKDLRFFEEKFVRKQKKISHKDILYFGSGRRGFENILREDLVELINRTQEILKRFKNNEVIKEVTKSRLFFRDSNIAQALVNNKEELFLTYDFLKKLQEIKNPEKISLKYEFIYNDDALKIKRFELTVGDFDIINVDLQKSTDNKSFISSDVIDFTNINNKQISELRKIFKNNKTIFSFIENYHYNEQNLSVVFYYFINYISQLIDKVEESFNSQSINYVSPLRAHPKRYYFLDKAKVNSFLDTLDGEAIAETLKENSALKNSVNLWFKKFNLHIDVGPIKDIIHQIVVKQNSLDLDITDVGFGVSQVLPVIIQGFLSKDKSITLIEQPEIHLHPKMQADLADLFIDISITKDNKKNSFIANKYLIIETHSEYLLKRLRRRISENKITANEIAIYYIEPQDESKSATITKIDISEKGAFDWPKDFYTGDLADDVTEFLKNQM